MDSNENQRTPPPDPYSANEGPGGMMPPPIVYPPPGYPPEGGRAKKLKWLAVLLAFCFPGTGHMYLGMMSRGVVFMLLLAMDICGIVFFAQNGPQGSVLIIVMLSLLIPILYAYNVFDVLQKTDAVNERHAAGYPPAAGWNGQQPASGGQQQVPIVGIILLAAGGLALFSTANTEWTRWLLHSSGSMTGAIVLLVIGAVVWLWERRGRSGKQD
ncbi:DUF6677 family protein [Cohnella zeiphila]|uniref:Uncharacterized protein n=1 Tax=Cohnella zeiphila TaxID=2761120 RepID=A0A7X0VXE5_9BACL|nr:DUF6677 family protein [Cohnella zeiphila]MBB6731843.1 hypothetical protein [Cohnella zeiphila]